MSQNKNIDVESLRDKFLGQVFDEYVFSLNADQLAQYAKSCGETAKRFTDPSDPDFQAPPTIASSFNPRKAYPDDFPSFEGLGMDAGKSVRLEKPMRAGEDFFYYTWIFLMFFFLLFLSHVILFDSLLYIIVLSCYAL